MNEMFEKNLFECEFDSFELDGFLSKVDAQVKDSEKKNLDNAADYLYKGKKKETQEKLTAVKNSLLSFQKLSGCDFDSKVNNLSSKPSCQSEVFKKTFSSCISPIRGSLASNIASSHSVSSTPVKKSQTPKYDYFEADLFEDWDNNEFDIIKKEKENKEDLITLSQAVKLVEEESAKVLEKEKQNLNLSINLLTGEVNQNDVENLQGNTLSESEVLKTDQMKNELENEFRKSLENNINNCKPSAAHKLNFCNEEMQKKNSTALQNVCFSSDDDDLFNEVCLNSKLYGKTVKVNNFDLPLLINTSSDESLNLEKSKKRNIPAIESDSADSSPSLRFCQWKKKPSKRKSFKRKQFVLSEAEVSDNSQQSSDEIEQDSEEYDKSFLDENSYCTQNASANMTAKYLESVKGIGGQAGNFKIPNAAPYNPINVFSQTLQESNTDYEFDSFCVTDFDVEPRTDLSDLEVAEKILEMDRKKRKKKLTFRQKKKKIF